MNHDDSVNDDDYTNDDKDVVNCNILWFDLIHKNTKRMSFYSSINYNTAMLFPCSWHYKYNVHRWIAQEELPWPKLSLYFTYEFHVTWSYATGKQCHRYCTVKKIIWITSYAVTQTTWVIARKENTPASTKNRS